MNYRYIQTYIYAIYYTLFMENQQAIIVDCALSLTLLGITAF